MPLLLTLLACCNILGCGGTVAEDEPGNEPSPSPSLPALLRLVNESQFEIQKVHLHEELGRLNTLPSVITESLDPGGTYESREYAGKILFVTVVRVKYAGGPLIAATTAQPIEIDSDIQVTYFDTEFRASDL